ncbi:MAG: trimethylamine methyltransferase family protein, partial [Geminicoccaceae bacterium]
MTRTGRRPRRDRSTGLSQAPSRQLYNPYPPYEILSADQIETIHHASLRVLAEIGVNFLLPEARDILRKAGAEVEPAGPRVRFDPAFVEERISTAPAQFTLHARNPERNVAIGGNAINFCMVASTP